jgi:hypothetical protein
VATDATDLRISIQQALDEVNSQLKGQASSDTDWTRKIKSKLVSLGKHKGFSCYASGVDGVSSGEWLYDLCWLSYADEISIGRIELAMESEWLLSLKEIRDDFVKLVQARARLRLMIWQSQNAVDFEAELDALKDQVRLFEDSQDGDAYVFSCWIADDQQFAHRSYDHEAA